MLSRLLTGQWLAQRQSAAALSLALSALLGCHNITTSLEGPLLNVGRETPVEDPDLIDQWPGWRGGLASGVSPALTLPTQWSQHENVRFRIEIPGRGHSSPIVWDDAIFLTSVVGDEHRAQLALMRVDRETGNIAWQRQLGQPIGTPHLKNGHASATPATDGERVYAYFGAKGLFCFDYDGNRLWHQPLAEQSHDWGTSSSPVIAGSLVLQLCDSQDESFLSAFDKLTGEIVWRERRDSHACWTTPVVVRAGAKNEQRWQVIVNGSGSRDGSNGFISAYDLWSGKPTWQLRGTADIVCPTAIAGEDLVVAASGVSGPLQAIEIGNRSAASQPDIRWQHRSCGPCAPTGVIYRERLYSVTSDGILSCLAIDDGRTLWHEQLGSPMSASLVAGAGHIYAATESGEVYVFKAGDKAELAATNSLHELCLATPAIADNEIFLRTESRLYCIAQSPASKLAGDPAVAAELSTDTVVSPSDLPIE
jgi:outer membrane protein assembly factor BamB